MARWVLVLLVMVGMAFANSVNLAGGPPKAAAQGSVKPFIMPVPGESGPSSWLMGQPYGNTTGAFVSGANNYSAGQFLHFGIDVSMPCGTPLVAVAEGVVDSVDNMSRGSAPHNLLITFPELNVTVLYGHLLERPALVAGQAVQQGQVVALSGDPAGDCDSRPHLHFEVRDLSQRRAYNPIHFIEAPWHSLVGLGYSGRSIFQRDLMNARRWLSLEDQPDVQFGGARLNAYSATLPDSTLRRIPATAPLERNLSPLPDSWTLRQVGVNGCCAGAWWHPSDSNLLYFIDGGEGQLASVFELPLPSTSPLFAVGTAPPPIQSADGSHQLRYEANRVIVQRLADGAEWYLEASEVYPTLSPDNRLLLWTLGGGAGQQVRVAALDGSINKVLWSSGRGASVRWLDSERVLISQSEPGPGRYTTLTVANVQDETSFSLGTYHYLRNVQVAPGGERLSFLSAFNPDPSDDGMFVIEVAPNARPMKLPWLADHRWRDAEHLFYITFDAASDLQTLNAYHLPSGTSTQLSDPAQMPFTIANGDWSVSPDGNRILFQEARDDNLWLLEVAEQAS